MAESRAFSIRIFLPGGTADGLKVVEKSNWSGRCVVCPRPLLPESKSREEFQRTGVYVLYGPTGEDELPTVYIGQGAPVRPRLESHYANKDFWTHVAFFVSKDENLNKAHIQHLESRLVELAKEAKRCTLDNGNTPAPTPLSEMDTADAEGFLDEMLLCLPLLGLHYFTKPAQRDRTDLLHCSGPDADAYGYESSEGFVVTAGGRARGDEVESISRGFSAQRKNLVELGVLTPTDGGYRFSQDYTFSSPSQAAVVVLGRNANGRTEWKDDQGRTLKELQEAATDYD